MTSGGADMMLTLTPTVAAKGAKDGYGRVDYVANGGTVVTFNVTAPPFNDVRARQALMYAIDRHAMNDRLYGGASTPADNVFDPKSPYYDASQNQPNPDQAKAQSLLDALAAEGKPLSFTLIGADAFSDKSQFIQAQLAEYKNIKVSIQTLGGAEFTKRTSPGSLDYQAGMSIVQFSDPGGINRSLVTGGNNNRAGYSNPAMDAALTAGIASTDVNQRKPSYKTMTQLLNQDVPYIFLDRSLTTLLTTKKVQNVKYLSTMMVVFEQMWVTK
jgi:peptide/nickel transport system substrate-binding protein